MWPLPALGWCPFQSPGQLPRDGGGQKVTLGFSVPHTRRILDDCRVGGGGEGSVNVLSLLSSSFSLTPSKIKATHGVMERHTNGISGYRVSYILAQLGNATIRITHSFSFFHLIICLFDF